MSSVFDLPHVNWYWLGDVNDKKLRSQIQKMLLKTILLSEVAVIYSYVNVKNELDILLTLRKETRVVEPRNWNILYDYLTFYISTSEKKADIKFMTDKFIKSLSANSRTTDENYFIHYFKVEQFSIACLYLSSQVYHDIKITKYDLIFKLKAQVAKKAKQTLPACMNFCVKNNISPFEN